jgi:hypothetical protein
MRAWFIKAHAAIIGTVPFFAIEAVNHRVIEMLYVSGGFPHGMGPKLSAV